MSDHATHNDKVRVGQVKEITSLSNPVIKDIRALSMKKHRDETGTFLAEGLKLVIDAIELGWSIRTLIYAKGQRGKDQVEKIAALTIARGGLVLEVSDKVLTAITRRDNPQETVRATMGSIFAVPLVRVSEAEFLAWSKKAEPLVVGSHLKGSVDYRSIGYKGRPVILLMGNEQQGLPDTLAKACGKLARIPQTGRADSLNLAIATGVMLFEARRHLLDLAEPAATGKTPS